MNGQDRHSGFTLIELLVVMAIIVLLSSVTVPAMMRGGFFSGNPTDTAARDLFALLRASQVYATTHNVDAAIAYGIAVPQDSLYSGTGGVANDSAPLFASNYFVNAYPNLVVKLSDSDHRTETAVFDSSMLIRRITIQELNQVANGQSLAGAIIQEFDATEWNNGVGTIGVQTYDKTKEVFVPVGTTFGSFQEFPSDTCVLANDPSFKPTATQPNGTLEAGLGVQGVYIIRYDREFDSVANDFVFRVDRIMPRVKNDRRQNGEVVAPEQGLLGALNADWRNKFPAHVFKRSGGLDANTDKQRMTLSMGLLPDADYYDRYMYDEENDELLLEGVHLDYSNTTDAGYYNLVSRDTQILIYKATGRVKVAADDE